MKDIIVSILGCGWLGKELGKHLISKSYQVKGSTTSLAKFEDLTKEQIEPFLITLPATSDENHFWDADILVIAFPPGLRKGNASDFTKKIETIHEQIAQRKYKKVIYVSSTSVYKNDGSIKSEGDVDISHILYQAEQTLSQACQETSTPIVIARCGGLMGYDRFPCKYYSIENPIAGANAKVNYIHRDDVVRILGLFIENSQLQGVFNLVSDKHPTRKEVLLDCFRKQKQTVPKFTNEKKDFKVVTNEKLIKTTGYTFKYPDPLGFYYSL